MSELVERLAEEFRNPEYRHFYADECLNTMIATQIKVLREQRNMTQGQLAEDTGMRQPRIPLLEDANYSNWTINTLRRIARAFDVALSVHFESFSKVVQDFENMNRENLQRPDFAHDSQFHVRRRTPLARLRRRRHFRTQLEAAHGTVQLSLFQTRGELIQWPQQRPEIAAATARQGASYAVSLSGTR
jgi:transcriptional regulator with XRE-family HTH domain